MENDRDQGQAVTEHEVKDFSDCIKENLLSEVRAVGCPFTWCNNQEGGNRIHSNIDRCMANTTWLQEYHYVIVERMEREISNHNPQVLDFNQQSRNRSSPFRFFNVLADHQDSYGGPEI